VNYFLAASLEPTKDEWAAEKVLKYGVYKVFEIHAKNMNQPSVTLNSDLSRLFGNRRVDTVGCQRLCMDTWD
jgi:hypothetical protein